jgi:hypothetical protein
MLRFLRRLARKFQMAHTKRTPRRAQRRAMLGLEGLEERTVMSTASLSGSTLLINASPGHFESAGPRLNLEVAHIRDISIQQDAAAPAKLEVLDSGKVLGTFPIASIKTIDIKVAGLDSVTVDDRDAFPGIHPPVNPSAVPDSVIAHGSIDGPFTSLTAINISGSGSLNSFTVVRSFAIPLAVSHIVTDGAQHSLPAGPSVSVTLNPHRALDLSLDNVQVGILPPESLTIIATGGKFSSASPTTPTGSERVTFAGGITSEIDYSNFASVTDVSGPHITHGPVPVSPIAL